LRGHVNIKIDMAVAGCKVPLGNSQKEMAVFRLDLIRIFGWHRLYPFFFYFTTSCYVCQVKYFGRSAQIGSVLLVKATDADERIDGKRENDGAAIGFQTCTFTDCLHDLRLVFVRGQKDDGIGLLRKGRADQLLCLAVANASGVQNGGTRCSRRAAAVDDLIGEPLFCSEQSWQREISEWADGRIAELSLEGSFRLSYNGSMFALEGLGVLLTFEHLVDCSEGSGLVFRPLHPVKESSFYLIWSKYQTFTPIAERFLSQITRSFSE
jgi:hypothetical protein